MVGYVLAFFLGGIGAHAFYYRKYVKGSLYLLFSWTFVPILLGWIDMFNIKAWHNKLEANSLIPKSNLKQKKATDVPLKKETNKIKMDDLAVKNRLDKDRALFSDGRPLKPLAEETLKREEHKNVKQIIYATIEEQQRVDYTLKSEMVLKPKEVQNIKSPIVSPGNTISSQVGKRNEMKKTVTPKPEDNLVARNSTACKNKKRLKDEEATTQPQKTPRYPLKEIQELVSTLKQVQQLHAKAAVMPSVVEESLKNISDVNVVKPSNQFYNEGAIILDKYRHIETPREILKDIEQIRHGSSSNNNNSYVMSFSHNGSRFIKHSLDYSTKRGVESQEIPLHAYWTTFDSLNHEQKKWYFYWREQVLYGKYLDVDLSYIILFVYELLNYSFNQKAAFNISMMVRLHDNYVERLPKVKTYIGNWTADMLREVGENDLMEEWRSSSSEFYMMPLYKQLKEKQDELARISFTTWKPYIRNYKETVFFTANKHKIYKIFKESFPLLQEVYQKQGEQLIDRYFKMQEERTVKHLYTSAVMGRETNAFHVQTIRTLPSARINDEVTALFRLAENVTRLLNGEKRQIRVDESFLPEGFKEMMIEHFTPVAKEKTKRFKVVQKAENSEDYGKVPLPLEETKVPEQKTVIEFNSANIKAFQEETEELIAIFNERSTEEDGTPSFTAEGDVSLYGGNTNTKHETNSETTNARLDTEVTDSPVERDTEHSSIGEAHTENETVLPKGIATSPVDIFIALGGGGSVDGEEDFIESLNAIEREFLVQFDNGVYNRNAANTFLKQRGIMLGMFINEINEKASEYLGDNFLESQGAEIAVYEEFEQCIITLKETE